MDLERSPVSCFLAALHPGSFLHRLLLALVVASAFLGHPLAVSAHDARPPQPVNVVLVHGFTDTGAIFNPLVSVLEKQGCHCFAPTLRPTDFRYGVHDLTLKLAAEIDARFGRSQPLILIAQSMGGLVARDYVQNLGGDRRVRACFMIVTANHGTLWANLSPGGGVRDFAIGSPFLRALNADLSAWKSIPAYAYWTPFDFVVVPSISAMCSFGRSKSIPAPFHQSMVKDRELMADIAAKIQALPDRPFASAGNGR